MTVAGVIKNMSFNIFIETLKAEDMDFDRL